MDDVYSLHLHSCICFHVIWVSLLIGKASNLWTFSKCWCFTREIPIEHIAITIDSNKRLVDHALLVRWKLRQWSSARNISSFKSKQNWNSPLSSSRYQQLDSRRQSVEDSQIAILFLYVRVILFASCRKYSLNLSHCSAYHPRLRFRPSIAFHEPN